MAEIRRGVCDAMLAQRVRAIIRVQAVVLGAASASPCGVAAAPATYQVIVEQMRFNPPTLTVKRGDRVQWVNRDLVAHTATSGAKRFDSGSIAPNASWTYVAGQAGSYPYLCQFHPTMHGILNVR